MSSLFLIPQAILILAIVIGSTILGILFIILISFGISHLIKKGRR